MKRYLVAARHAWNHAAFERHVGRLPGEWHFVSRREELDLRLLEKLDPRYVFFPHWNWLVPETVWSRWESVCFHMTDVPYGRGGSPLQNLILRGHAATKLTALRMERELDAGPVYMKRPLDLAGSAQAIFERAADLVYDMIAEIVAREPVAVPQQGEAVVFTRRTPAQSALPADATTQALYDHIRMLDAEGYPKAFVDRGPLRLEFTDAELVDGRLSARVEFLPRKDE